MGFEQYVEGGIIYTNEGNNTGSVEQNKDPVRDGRILRYAIIRDKRFMGRVFLTGIIAQRSL